MRMDKCGFDVLRVKIKLIKRKTPSNEWESEGEIACNVLQNWLSDPSLQHIACKRKRETRACAAAVFFSPLQFLFHAKEILHRCHTGYILMLKETFMITVTKELEEDSFDSTVAL